MKTLGRNADNDLYLEAGGLAILHDADAQCSVIEAILQTQKGELQFDQDKGIDYFGTVLQNVTYIDFWAAQVQARISELDFVASVDDFTYRFDSATSTLYWSMTVTNKDDERLDLQNKKTVLDTSPGIDISWNDIYDKPTGVQQTLDMVEAMHEEAVDTRETLTSSSTFRETKALLNKIIFDPNNEEYSKTRLVTFTFTGVPLGTVIDVSNLRLDIANTAAEGEYYAPFIFEIDDGLKVRADQTIDVSATGNKVVFFDTERGQDEEGHPYTTQKHTLTKGGTITITIRGNITRIWCADETKPIFLNSKGLPFSYLSGFSVGERVPLAGIGSGSFYGFNNLQKVEWKEGDEKSISFGERSFYGCSSLMEITWLPKKTTSLGVGCFQGCKSLVSLKGLESTLVEEIPDDCFYGCTQLKNCGNLPEKITSIGARVFKGCTSFKNIDELPQTVSSLGEECFCGCTGMTAILYPPESLTKIGKRCFAECTAMESLYITNATNEIGEGAFAGCSLLSNIMSDAASVPALDVSAFVGEAPIVYVPASLLQDYQGDAVWGGMTVKKYGVYEFGLKDVAVGTTLLSTTSNLASDSIWTITFGAGDKQQRFIPSVAALPSFKYAEAASAATITLKGYVRRISAASSDLYPFIATSAGTRFTNLGSVTIKDSPLEWIGDYTFAQCPNLQSIDCGFEEERDYCLGERAFWGCSSLSSTRWLKAGLGRLVKERQTTYEQGEDGTIIPIETIVLYPAFGDRCFWQSGITALEYDATDVTELPPYCFAETRISSIDRFGTAALTSLGDHCFYKCGQLNSITALRGTGITTLPDYCFAECQNLHSIEGMGSLVSDGMGSHVFENCSIESLSPIARAAMVTAIAPYMFAGCSLTDLKGLTEKIVTLGEGCFSRNANLIDISILSDHAESPKVTAIPAKCFQASGIIALIGCWNITSIGAYAFADCSGLVATSGLGPDIASIGDYAFQNCTGLKQVSCVALQVPSISSTAFSGVPTSGIPLYVRESMVSYFYSATTWKNFSRVVSRTIKVHLQNVGGDEEGDVNISPYDANDTGVRASIDPSLAHSLGVWYVDYGDDTPLEHYYAESGHGVQNALSSHEFKTAVTTSVGGEGQVALVPTRWNYTITLFGDIIEIWGQHTDDVVNSGYPSDNPENMAYSPFLGALSPYASAITISSDYLKKIGNFCFFNYGQKASGANDNSLSVSIEMNGKGTIGDYAFAKKDTSRGPIGTLGAFNAVGVGAFAFYQCGLTSSSIFTSIVTAAEAAYAKNPLLPDLSGFSSLREVSNNLFDGCSGLVTTSGLSSVTKIHARGFRDCSGLVTVKNFNDSFSLIEDSAFEGCQNISRIFMANVNPPALEEHGFDDDVFASAIVFVPAGKEETYAKTDYWSRFAQGVEGRIRSRSIEFTLTNVTAGDKTMDGTVIVSATGNWVLSYGDGEQTFQFKFNERGTAIPSYTFNKTSAKKVVKISGPVTSIRSSSTAYPIFGQSVGTNPWLTNVVVSDAMEITEFGDYLFSGCSELRSIPEADTIVSVGEYAFANATQLSDISGLSNVASIGLYAFSGCSSLTNLYGLHSVTTLGERAFNGCSSLRKIDGLGTGVTSIGDYAFASCPLQEVQMFAEEPPTMPTTAFSGLSAEVPLYVRTKSLTAYKEDSAWGSLFSDIRSRFVEFTLTGCPSNLTVKGDCGKVKSETYWVVDWDAYESNGFPCSNGTEERYLPGHTYPISGNHTLRIEGAVTSIGCAEPTVNNIASPYEEAEVTVVPSGENSISGTSFLTLEHKGTILDGEAHLLTRISRSKYSVLAEVGPSAFLRNKKLSAAYLSGITSIGIAAFAYDTAIETLSLLDTVGNIGKYAFYGCSGLTSVVGLNGLADSDKVIRFSIADYAFGGIPNLKYIQVGVPVADNAKITDLSFGKYETADDQHNVYVYVPLESISSYLGNAKWKKFAIASQILTFTMLHVPTGTTIQGISETNSSGVARIVSESRWTVDWDDGTMNTMASDQTSFPSHTYIYDGKANSLEKARWETINGVMCRKKIEISITGAIKSLSCQSSANYPFLATEIGRGNPYLVSVSAPESMRSIETLGDFVFQGCTALESVTGFCHVTSIGQYAFNGCTALTNIGDSKSGFAECTSIGNKAFANCQNLQSLSSFPKVRSIGIRSFENCISLTGTTGLGKNYQDKTIAQWEDDGMVASFGAYAFDGCGFGAIDMFNYQKPPVIQNSTFPGDPSDVLVFVSPAEGVLDAYKGSAGWSRYFRNIIATSNLTFTIGEGNIPAPTVTTEDITSKNPVTGEEEVIGTKTTTRGIALYGANGRLDFSGQYVLIDWGDGTTTTKLNTSGEDVQGWTFPNHAYSSGVTGGAVTISIRGDIAKIYTADAYDVPLEKNATPQEGKMPFIALAPFEMVVDTSSESQLPEISIDSTPENISYKFKLDIKVGDNSKLARIGTYCFNGSNISSLSLGKPSADYGIEIGDCAFWKCNSSSLKPVASYGAVKLVGAYAFAECIQLETTDFIAGASSIGKKAFFGCSSIKGVTLSSTMESVCDSAFEGCKGITEGIFWEQATDASMLAKEDIKIGDRAFYGCAGQNNDTWKISLPSQLHIIGVSAFAKCGMGSFSWGSTEHTSTAGAQYQFQEAESPNDTAGIFEGCPNLTSVSIAHELATIPTRAFCSCNKLTIVKPIRGLATINPYAFYGCSNLSEESIAKVLANAAGTIGQYAFAKCGSINKVSIPATVTALGEGCFNRSSDYFMLGNYEKSDSFEVGEVPIYHGLKDYEDWMTETYGSKRIDKWGIYDRFLYVPSTTDLPLAVSWGNSSGIVGEGCFMNCQGLNIDWANFPQLTRVPDYCFYNCQNLFSGDNLSVLPDSITYFGRFSLARTGMVGIGRSKTDKDTGETIKGSPISANLSPALFLGCSNLKTLGDVKGEGESQFVDGLACLFSTIPSAIPDGCFYGCSSLSDINTLSADVPNIKRLGQYCFANCTSLSGRGEHNITSALSNITQIDDGCFMNCSGIKGEFNGIPHIDYYPYRSFYGCTGISEISQFYDPSISREIEVTLEGESFGGIPVLDKINLPYSTMVKIVGANGSNDPFSGVPYNDDGKRDAVIVVPNELISEYSSDSYWTEFYLSTSFEGLTPCMVITMSVPSVGGTIKGFGRIEVDTTETDMLAFSWGDGTADTFTNKIVGGVLDLSGISHTYNFGLPEGGVEQSITLSIYGDVTAVSGDADNMTSSVKTNKTVVPFLYTAVTAMQSSQPVPKRAVNTWFRSITFSTSKLTKIGNGAFGYCTKMAAPDIPLSVTEIGNNAFFGCDKITSLDMIPEGSAISKLGQYCFAYCDNLVDYSGFARLTTIEAVPDGCFAKTSSVIPGTQQKLDWLPASVKSIGFAAFQHVCFSYFAVQTTTPITVGNYAFRYNNSLVNFTNGNGNPGIRLNLTGTNVFRDCKALNSLEGLTLSSANSAIPTGTFRGCSALSDISDIPPQITTIGDASFYGTAVADLSQIPSSITTIGADPFPPYDEDFVKDLGGAFEECRSLNTLEGMPSSITKIGTAAFKGCVSLKNLTGLSGSVTKLGAYCFYGCTMMEKIDGLSSRVSALPEGGFGNCPGLTSLSIPSAIATIGKKCFEKSANLNRIVLHNTGITNLEDNPSSDVSANCFPYDTLNKTASFQIVVPPSALAGYRALWAATGRFDSGKIGDGS